MLDFFLNFPAPLVVIYALSELLVLRFKRKDSYADDHDDGSLQLVVLCTMAGFTLFGLGMLVPQARLALLAPLFKPAIGVFALGLFLRWYAILRLGRSFTTEVAIVVGHTLVDKGLFRFVRHPSYAGLLLMLLAIGIRSGNVVALVLLEGPVIAGLLYRIRIEEAALTEAFPEYADYMRKTWRLIPFLY